LTYRASCDSLCFPTLRCPIFTRAFSRNRFNLDLLLLVRIARVLLWCETDAIAEFGADFVRYTSKEYFHEAAYDAYITGLVMLKMAYKLAPDKSDWSSLSPSNPAITPYLNRLFMMASDTTFHLGGKDVVPNRRNIVYVFDFPEKTTTQDLLKHFSRFGQARVHWISNIDAFVAYKEGQDTFSFDGIDAGRFRVLDFDSYQRENRAEKTLSNKRRLSESTTAEIEQKRRKHRGSEFPENCIIV